MNEFVEFDSAMGGSVVITRKGIDAFLDNPEGGGVILAFAEKFLVSNSVSEIQEIIAKYDSDFLGAMSRLE